MRITGAELFVKALLCENVDTLFAYPGGQAIDLFDAVYGTEGINVVLARHEQGLIHAADGYARSTGRVGVCLVTSGPGAANLVTGIATANYDSVPLVCFTGQVPTHLLGNGAFQEIDIAGITKSITKYSVTVKKRDELAGVIKHAFFLARSGKPGVVVVDLPKDIQQALGSDEYPKKPEAGGNRSERNKYLEQTNKALDCLKRAKRPLFLLGGGVNISCAQKEMTVLAEKTGIPLVTTIMGKGAVSTNHPLYIGNVGVHGSYAANTAVQTCDVLFSIGVRFSDRIVGKADEFAKEARMIHANIEPDSISRDVRTDILIRADAKDIILTLLERTLETDFSEWRRQIENWKRERPVEMGQYSKTGVTPLAVIQKINSLFSDVIIAADVGQNQLWTAQFLELTEKKRMLTSGGFGTMGYGLAAAIGAKLGNPQRDVIAVCGDGGIQMTVQEIATAVACELPVIICILNNGYLGNVRQWQEMFYNRHYSGTCLRRQKRCPVLCNTPSEHCPEYIPDFVRLAESYGARGIRVTKYEEIKRALLAAKHERKAPVVIEFIIEREENVLPIVPPGKGLGDMSWGKETE